MIGRRANVTTGWAKGEIYLSLSQYLSSYYVLDTFFGNHFCSKDTAVALACWVLVFSTVLSLSNMASHLNYSPLSFLPTHTTGTNTCFLAPRWFYGYSDTGHTYWMAWMLLSLISLLLRICLWALTNAVDTSVHYKHSDNPLRLL